MMLLQDLQPLDVEFDDEPIIVAVIGDPGKLVKAESHEDDDVLVTMDGIEQETSYHAFLASPSY